MLTPLSTTPRVTLDCSHSSVDGEERLTSFTQLIHWVESCPHRRGVHVYVRLPSHDPAGRKLKNALQALGCTVTARAVLS